MIQRRVRLISAIIAASMLTVASAAAQQGQQTKPQVVVPLTKPVTGVIKPDPAAAAQQAQADARTRTASLTCQGPLTLEILAKDPRDASKGIYYLLSFKEAAAASGMKPGECWRAGGFSFGSGAFAGDFNGGLKKGDLVYDPPMLKCPVIKSMKFENGVVTGTFNETAYSDKLLNAATKSGSHSFDSKWLNSNQPTGLPGGWGHYVAQPGDATSPIVSGCYR